MQNIASMKYNKIVHFLFILGGKREVDERFNFWVGFGGLITTLYCLNAYYINATTLYNHQFSYVADYNF